MNQVQVTHIGQLIVQVEMTDRFNEQFDSIHTYMARFKLKSSNTPGQPVTHKHQSYWHISRKESHMKTIISYDLRNIHLKAVETNSKKQNRMTLL